jgi:hypothetical protein
MTARRQSCSVLGGPFDATLQYLRTYALSHTTSRIDVELGGRLFDHLLRLPLAYFGTQRAKSNRPEGRNPERLLIEGHRVRTPYLGAERSNERISERAKPFLKSDHGREDLLLAFENENIDL